MTPQPAARHRSPRIGKVAQAGTQQAESVPSSPAKWAWANSRGWITSAPRRRPRRRASNRLPVARTSPRPPRRRAGSVPAALSSGGSQLMKGLPKEDNDPVERRMAFHLSRVPPLALPDAGGALNGIALVPRHWQHGRGGEQQSRHAEAGEHGACEDHTLRTCLGNLRRWQRNDRRPSRHSWLPASGAAQHFCHGGRAAIRRRERP